MKVAVVGGVKSTDLLIRKLLQHGFGDLRVFGYAPGDTRLVSGWVDLAATAAELRIDYVPFVKVSACEAALRAFNPHLIFAVGLSQILPPALLSIARKETIGFHPTALPKGRGRAALAWLVLEGGPGAATFFGIREGIDDGPIYAQKPYAVGIDDDAASVEQRMLQAEAEILDSWLPGLREGDMIPYEQDQASATWFGRRTPLDGWIDWSRSAECVLRLIRASTRPHPGAITVAGDVRLTIWKAVVEGRPELGVVGRILWVGADGSFIIQTGSGLLRITEWESERPWKARVGALLGYYPEAEILALRDRCSDLERRLISLEDSMRKRGG